MDGEFTERENFGDFSGFGDLPDDLRNTTPLIMPDKSFVPPIESDGYSLNGGADRPYLDAIPPAFASEIRFQAINYLPRANYESFRSQRFFAGGVALLPSDPTVFVDLLVDTASLPPGAAVSYSTGPLLVPGGFAAVITGIRQWIGDTTAYQKLNGQPDDIFWKVTAGSTSIFEFGNFPFLISSMSEEGHMFAIANEGTNIQLSVRNNIDPSDPLARDIPVQAVLTGHWFPIDELNDIFRNR